MNTMLHKVIPHFAPIFIVAICCFGIMGNTAMAGYGGTMQSYSAPSQVALGADLNVSTIVKNTGSDTWIAYGTPYNRPSYYIAFKNLSWEPYHTYQSAMMFHMYANDTDSRTTTLHAANMPTTPGNYSFSLECSYHTSTSGDNYTTMVNCPVTINFSIPQVAVFDVSASAGANGSIVPGGNISCTQGSEKVFNAYAADGYVIDIWYLDGIEVQFGGTSYTLSNIQAGHAVSVSFKKLACSDTVFSEHDFDGDGVADIAVFYPATGFWYILYSSGGSCSTQWGTDEYIPVPGDYDGDGETDLAIYSEVNGNWDISFSSGGLETQNWGWSAALPVQGDFDGDQITDIAVYYQVTGNWYILFSGGGSSVRNWGWNEALPVPADYDGDTITDIAVYYPVTGDWYIQLSSGGMVTQNWGWDEARPIQCDYDGDGKSDIGVYYPFTGNWYILLSGGGMTTQNWGWSEALPVPADYDGDERADLAVFYAPTGNWYIKLSGGGMRIQNMGWSAVMPIQ